MQHDAEQPAAAVVEADLRVLVFAHVRMVAAPTDSPRAPARQGSWEERPPWVR